MRLRNFLINSGLWKRLVKARRDHRRSVKELRDVKKAHEKEIIHLKQFYEKRLQVERLKVEMVNNQWADRFLEIHKLRAGISLAASDAEERVDEILYTAPERKSSPEDSLSPDELNFYLDEKDGFWEAEAENGRTDSEIQKLWDTQFKNLAIARAKTFLG